MRRLVQTVKLKIEFRLILACTFIICFYLLLCWLGSEMAEISPRRPNLQCAAKSRSCDAGEAALLEVNDNLKAQLLDNIQAIHPNHEHRVECIQVCKCSSDLIL